MKRICSLVLAALLLTGFATPSSAPLAADQDRCVLGWLPYWDQKRAFESFMQNADLFGHLSMFWYNLDASGRIVPYRDAEEDRRLVEFAQSKGVKVLGLIANLPDDEPSPWLSFVSSLLNQVIEPEQTSENWDRKRVADMLATSENRRRHIGELVKLTERMGFDGINIDYEALLREDRDGFSLFIEELAVALHAKEKILAVALHAKTSEFNPMEDNGSHAQDWQRISAVADQLHFITYGQHWAATPPGPIASPKWVDRVLQFAVNESGLPREKVILGIPLYAEDWFKENQDCHRQSCYQGSGQEVLFADIRQFLREQGNEIHWDDEHQTSYVLYETSEGNQHITWFEDSRSMEAKIALRDQYDICRIGLWRLGGEDPQVWDIIRRAMKAPGRRQTAAETAE